jgi:hypothetical protein
LLQLNEASDQFAVEMHHVEGSSNQAQDIHEFNRELQWTLVKMKKDNDELTDSL